MYLVGGKNCLSSRAPGFTRLGSRSVFGGFCVAHRFSFLCCVFVLLVFVLCLVHPMLPVSLDCPFLVAHFITTGCKDDVIPGLLSV